MLYLFLTTHSLQIGLAHTAWTGRFQTDPHLQISAIILPISSSSTQRYLVPAEKNNLIILHNFADLLAAFISVDLNITVMFYKLLKYKLQRRHSIFLGDCQWCLMKKFGIGHLGMFLIRSTYLKTFSELFSVTCCPAPICNTNRKSYDQKAWTLKLEKRHTTE